MKRLKIFLIEFTIIIAAYMIMDFVVFQDSEMNLHYLLKLIAVGFIWAGFSVFIRSMSETNKKI